MKTFTIILFSLILTIPAWGYDPKDYEEDAGSSFEFLFNSEYNIYGISFGSGTWIKNTPVFGDYSLRLLSNKHEDAWYSGIGLTIRLMPHWRFAPFVGAGGSYNHSLTHDTFENDTFDDSDDGELPERGDSYWGGHVETGFRIWMKNRIQLFELKGRYTWSSLSGDHDYWLIGIGTGAGI